MRPIGHSCGREYNPRLILSIWCAPQVPSCQTYIYSVKSCPEKSRPIKYAYTWDQMHGVMIAIEYCYQLGRKKYFNLWCELGRLLLRQSHITIDKIDKRLAVRTLTANLVGYCKNFVNFKIQAKYR